MQTKHWKEHLAEILREHNERHGKRNKIVANITRHQRGQRLYSCFQQLRDLGYKIENPCNLKPRHVKALIDHWIAAQRSPATIQTWVSHLRVFARWIGKPGMIRSAMTYASDPERLKRHYAAKEDASWSAHNVDVQKVITQVASIDACVGDQLLAALLFGMRVKEAVTFKPWLHHVGDSIHIIDGTKGGRPRVVPVLYPEQRDALDAFKMRVRSKRHSLADPALTLKQALSRYYSVMRAVGINKKTLGVTSHGLRKQFANQRYWEATGVPSPIQHGPKIDRELDREARLTVAESLGHAREQIAGAYLGPIFRSMKASGRLSDPPSTKEAGS